MQLKDASCYCIQSALPLQLEQARAACANELGGVLHSAAGRSLEAAADAIAETQRAEAVIDITDQAGVLSADQEGPGLQDGKIVKVRAVASASKP